MKILDSNKKPLGHVALLISMYFSPEPGGGAATAWNRALILHKLGYTVFVLCGFPSYPTGNVTELKYKGKFFYVEKIGNFTLIRLRLLPLKSKGYLRRFVLFINFNFLALIWMIRILKICLEPELVYALAPILFSSPIGYLYSKLTRSFFIYEVSAFWPEELVAFKINFFSILLLIGKFLAKISYSLPEMIIVISERAAKYVTKNYNPNALVYALPIGVEPSRFPTRSKESSRKELIEKKIFPSILDNKFIVLYAGVISRITRVENLAYAANKLKDAEKDIVFLVIGEGEERQKIDEIRLSNNINNLYLLPFQDYSLVPYIISAADVCVVPLSSEPIYDTTLPTKFFDHLACHKPQIGICTGEVADIINSNNIGITVKDGEIDKLVDAILTLKNSPSLIQSMEKNTHSVLEFFSLDTLALRLNDALSKEIARKKRTEHNRLE
jgi:glycosyltransferase involved in cell wall biosynthesis